MCQGLNVVKYIGYKGHRAKHLKDAYAHLVTDAHEIVAGAVRRVVRALCLELSHGIRNVREGTHDVHTLHSIVHQLAFGFAVQESLLRRGSWQTR